MVKNSSIFNFKEPLLEWHYIKRYTRKLPIFLLPFLFLFSFPLIIMLISGEFTPIERVITEQTKKSSLVLYGPAYHNAGSLKLKSVLYRKPDIIAMGSSRSTQFRSKFFNNSISFYNASNFARIKQFRLFLTELPEELNPKIIIIGLDQWFFNYNVDTLEDEKNAFKSHNNILGTFRKQWRQVYFDYISKKFHFADLFIREEKIKKIGLNAIVRSNGFRNDGSYYYGAFISDPSNPENRQFTLNRTFKEIDKGLARFRYGQCVSKPAVDELKLFLEDCKKRDIYVIGFLPPFVHSVYLKFHSMGDRYEYMRQIEPAIRPIFNKYDFSLYDFSDLASIGASDEEIIDTIHGSEKAYLRLFIKMAETDEILAEYVDIAYLKERLVASNSHYDVFENEF